MLASRIAATASGGKRLRNSTMVDAPKGAFELYAFIPRKNWRYGFSLTCRTVHSSLHFSRCLMMSAPSAIRAECAGCPLSTNCFAYSRSTVSQGTKPASLTHSFSESSSPNGKTKSSNVSWISFLYIRPHSSASFLWVLHVFSCTCIIPYWVQKRWFSYVFGASERTLPTSFPMTATLPII